MYCNFTRSQTFPLALIRVSSTPRCFKSQYFPIGSHPKPTQNPNLMNFTSSSSAIRKFYCVKNLEFSTVLGHKISGSINGGKPISISGGFRLKNGVRNCPVLRVRSFSSAHSENLSEGNGEVRARKSLPWLAARKDREAKRVGKSANVEAKVSSWVESANRLEKAKVVEDSQSSWQVADEKLLEAKSTKVFPSSWDESERNAYVKKGKSIRENKERENKERKNRTIERVDNQGSGYKESDESVEEKEEDEAEAVDDPRWDRIRNRYQGIDNVRRGYEKPEVRRWNKEENWGRKTWKEATESSVPKMVGDGIYGVGPVLAALSAGRREFYVLYVQEGLELSSNNRKKKDRKGFEKVLRIAEKLGLSLREIPKHDLNMVVDNRPHQGLVLDASPLEMVRVKELDPVSTEVEKKGNLWVALDEVTDPQNLGAIIRSAYFFGASGVVLCAKNSAPLSGVVSKASAGSLELMELRSCKNMMQFLASSIDNGWRVLGGSVSSRAVPLNQISPGTPTILVLGSEGTGLRPLVERSCTQLIRIPGNIPLDVSAGAVEEVETAEIDRGFSGEEFRSFMAVESLNVSVAAGVLLHHLIGNYNDNGHLGDDQTETIVN